MASTDMYDRLKATAEAFINSYNEVHATQDMKKLSQHLTPDCRRNYAPHSLTALVPRLAAGLSNEDFENMEGAIFANHQVCENSIQDITVDERQRKVSMKTLHHTVTKAGQTFDFEHMNTLWMTEDGMKVRDIFQYTDSLQSKDFLDKAKAGESVKKFANE